MNSGRPEAGYGYWFPGADDDGAAAWGFNPAKYGSTWIPGDRLQARGLWPYDGEIDSGCSGALRAAATIVVNDPVFGLIAYGGKVHRRGSVQDVELRDGLQQKLDLLQLAKPIYIQLDSGAFVGPQQIKGVGGRVRLQLRIESRDENSDTTTLRLGGLHPGEVLISTTDGQDRSVTVGSDGRCTEEAPFSHTGRSTHVSILAPM